MTYVVLIVAIFVIPITVGAIAGARLSPGMCWLVLFGVLATMVGVPFALFQLLPRGSFPLLEDVAASFGLIAVFLNSAIIGEFLVGMRLGQERRLVAESELGTSTSDVKRSTQ